MLVPNLFRPHALIEAESEMVTQAKTRPKPAPAPQAVRPIQVGRADGGKAVLDFVLAVVLAVLAAPFVLFAAALVKLTSRGPVIYAQTRVGLNGRHFTIYKLRTMRHNCEAVSGVRWATAKDPRVTPVGVFLRKTHLDELPQLWNVLKGDMSLVGPRPERPEFVNQLVREVEGYSDRHTVKPGVTGLAQVQLPADSDLESVKTKLKYDRYYIDHRSLGLDLRLILSTSLKMFHIPFWVSRRLLLIPSGAKVEVATNPSPRALRPAVM